MHPKCRSSFWVRRSSLHRSGNSGDYGLNNSWKLPALKIQTTRSQKNKDSDNTRTEFMKNQSCSKGLFFFSTRICNFLWEISSCLEFWMTANQKHLLLWWDAFVIFSSSVTLWVIWHKQTWRLRHGLSLFLFTCRISFVLNQTWQTLTKLIYKSCINNFIAKSKTTEISCI